jgi:O-antigen biosynthesis protein
MKLSVVIVNFNVKFFLEQCLYSVFKAINGIDAEVFVVDNNSVDGSCLMVKEKFPLVKLIENDINKGFSAANNQALKRCNGEYLLLLNPDTLVEEDTFAKVISFMDAHPEAGGLGVKMIDGKGNFLPESKRSLPTPSVAFYKVFGLSALFPGSKKFGKYHLGFLDKDLIHEVEVLSGAFMLLRKSVINEIGMLDESFFMYGEDIDLSYRIIKAGYKNYYYPETTIIHYKGESTKKGSINYVVVFYKAMIIFARKHFTSKNIKTFSVLINFAIYLRAAISIAKRLFTSALLPLIESLTIFLGFYIIKPHWEQYKFPDGGNYPETFLLIAVPLYIAIWLITIFFTGGYDKPLKARNHLKGILWGTIFILVLYALVSEDYRFSRALIIFGASWSMLSLYIIRIIIKKMRIQSLPFDNRQKRAVIVGFEIEAQRVTSLICNAEVKPNIIGFVSPDNIEPTGMYIGHLEQIKEIVTINRIDEIIFCARDIPSQTIIKFMIDLPELNIDYKIASPDSISVIGSNSIHSAGELYTIHINSISKPENKRMKRTFDAVSSIFILSLLPFFTLINISLYYLAKNCINVLMGKKTWIGFVPSHSNIHLPKIKDGVVYAANMKIINLEKEADNVNVLYAKDYSVYNDLKFLIKNIRYTAIKNTTNYGTN